MEAYHSGMEENLLSLRLSWIRRIWRRMRPNPEFLCPYQNAGIQDPNLAWWHVPVTIRNWGKIKDSTICLIRLPGEDSPGDGIALRWQSRDHANGVSRATLRKGERLAVPIVFRLEGGDGSAIITNENWLMHRETKWKLEPRGMPYEFWLEVRRGNSRWRSPYRYAIGVPPPEVSNGHFTLSINYDLPTNPVGQAA